jgi:hypothetical protein
VAAADARRTPASGSTLTGGCAAIRSGFGRGAKHGELNRLLAARTLWTGNLLPLRHNELLVAGPTILTLVFVYWHYEWLSRWDFLNPSK